MVMCCCGLQDKFKLIIFIKIKIIIFLPGPGQ